MRGAKMNWGEMQKLPAVDRRVLLVQEVLAAIKDKRLKATHGYVSIVDDNMRGIPGCYSCAVGAAMVTKAGFDTETLRLNIDANVEDSSNETESFKAMVEAGFSNEQVHDIEAIFECNFGDIKDHLYPVMLWLHSGLFPERIDRMEALYTRMWRERDCQLHAPISRSEVCFVPKNTSIHDLWKVIQASRLPYYACEDSDMVWNSRDHVATTQYQYLIDDSKETTCKSL
jgi:hypothetical protein